MRRGLAVPIAVIACLATSLEHLGCAPSNPGGREADTDGDGLTDAEEVNVYGTSPVLADTDGDEYSDYAEIVTLAFDPANDPSRFNPRVADVAQLTVSILGPPVVAIQTTEQDGTTNTIDNSVADMVGTQIRTSQTESNSRSDTLQLSRTNLDSLSVTRPLASGDRDAGAGAVDAGPDADATTPPASGGGGGGGDEGTITLSSSVASSVTPSTTFDTTISLTDEQILQNSQTLSRGESLARAQSVMAISGFLKVAAVMGNRSHLAFRVTNVALTATLVNDAGVVAPVQNLVLDQGLLSFQPFSLAPGEETGIASFVSVALTLETTRAVLRDARALVIRLATYEITDGAGRSLAFSITGVENKTALIVIDFGPQRPTEVYQVATNLDPAHPGVTAARAFGDILRIPYTADKETGLISVRRIAVNASGGAHWRVAWQYHDGPVIGSVPYGAEGEPYDFDSIEIHAGDVLHVALVEKDDPPVSEAGPIVRPPLGIGPGSSTDGQLSRP